MIAASRVSGSHLLTYCLAGADLRPAECRELTTWFVTFPMEGDAFAVRFWVGNVLPTPYRIIAATFSTSDSYGDYINPTNGTGWRAVTFSGGGADRPELDPPGEIRNATVPIAAPGPNGSARYEPYYSDWVSCSPVPPCEGSIRVGMLRVAMPAQSFSQIAAWQHPEWLEPGTSRSHWRRDEPGRWTANARVNRGRDYAVLTRRHADFATVPDPVAISAVHPMGHGPVVGVQYLTPSRGVVIATSGDSIASGTGTSGGVNDFVTQACAALSTPNRPVVPFKATWGGRSHESYLYQCRQALAQRPSILHLQGLSRNGWNGTYEAWAAQFADILRISEDANDAGIRVVISTGVPGGLNPIQLSAYNDRIFAEMVQSIRRPLMLFDTASLVCETDGIVFTGRFSTGLSDDDQHPNDAGHAVLSEEFQTILGLFELPSADRGNDTSSIPKLRWRNNPQPEIRVPGMTTQIHDIIDFGKSGNAPDYMSDGWSVMESDGCWTIGAASTIAIPRPDAPFGFFLEMEFTPNLRFPFKTSQILVIECEGRTVGSFTIDRSGIFAVFVPPVAGTDSKVLMRFIHPSYFRPSVFGNTAEGRELAFKFKRIRVMVLSTAWMGVHRKIANSKIQSVRIEEIVKEAQLITGMPIKELLNNFEVLAGNGDMGLALREIGYEWLSLLRFAGATPAVAIRGLENDFEGVGKEIRAEIAPNPMKEWMVNDGFGLRFHSGQSSLQVPEADLLKWFPGYAEPLRTKLMEDLDESNKIFVFADHRDMNSARSIEYVLPLYLALRRRSSAPLLWVCPSRNDLALKGSVVEVLPGLAIADLDLTAPPVLIGGGITVTGWVTVLCNAWNALKRNRH